ncbi:hypothetical protein KCU87_g421, partial [Aureobasidium melanogenum]
LLLHAHPRSESSLPLVLARMHGSSLLRAGTPNADMSVYLPRSRARKAVCSVVSVPKPQRVICGISASGTQ